MTRYMQFTTNFGTVTTAPTEGIMLQKAESTLNGKRLDRYFVRVMASDHSFEIDADEYEAILSIMRDMGVVSTPKRTA